MCMEAFAIPEPSSRLREAVDALVDESIDGFSTHALGEDVVDIGGRSIGSRPSRSVACIASIRGAAHSPMAEGRRCPGCDAAAA
jgi:hypothetical protein